MIKKASDFLQKFSLISQKSDSVKNEIQKILKETGFSLVEKKDILIKGKTLFIKTSPLKRAEIFLKKQKIIELLKSNPITTHLTDVR